MTTSREPVLNLVTDSAYEPVTLAQLKTHLRVLGAGDNDYITALGKAARRVAERYTGESLINATWTQTWDSFPTWTMLIGKAPFVSVTSLVYTDTDGVSQTLVENTDFLVDYKSHIPRITPAYGEVWSSTRVEMNAVVLTGVFGYGAMSGGSFDTLPANFPHEYIQFIKMCVAHMYENREPVSMISGAIPMQIPQTYYQFIRPYKRWET